MNCNFNHPILFAFEQLISLINLFQRERMGNQRCCINLARFNQLKDFITIATIYATSLKSQILAMHFRQRQHLWLVIKCHNSHNSV